MFQIYTECIHDCKAYLCVKIVIKIEIAKLIKEIAIIFFLLFVHIAQP